MKGSRLKTTKSGKCKVTMNHGREQQTSRASKVLAERNRAVVAVGAWVEEGQDFVEHPCALALLTEKIQAEKRRLTEESLRRFQDEVRHRVAQRAQVSKLQEQPQAYSRLHYVQTQNVSASKKLMSAGGASQQRGKGGSSQESFESMKQVRLRLAACRMDQHGEMTSDLPGGEWNISPSRHRSNVLRELEVEHREEVDDVPEEEEEGDDHVIISQHKCPLVQQKVSGHVLWDSEEPQPDSDFQCDLRVPRALWPLPDQEELKRQRQSQFLMNRRLYMNIEREQVKENKLHRKHLKRTARIKAEKEQMRLEEERRLERDRQLADARQRLEERELLIQERLRLEEEERAEELQRRRSKEKEKTELRFVEALRARMKERLSQEKLDLPPLCCCASSFWDSHPDTCANNCVFHNNPKEYAKALHSTMLSLDL
ncbi:coiled-coil domain-containing protein 15-like isoform X3 [Xyrichtys novacula]|uniref:Coiled-coil domain-containing protein 15-like isoform X3 n=1 Tax=Xyrichtys novacula TaxID=13765 RepID=A0AAV1FQG2_XYRNO|nr:coiled-coil domain-containing protein 15-like isoform X3 [Xyrichtys novacula]